MSLQHIQKNSPRLLPKPAKFEKNPPNGYRVIRKTKCGAGRAGGAAGAAGAGGARSSPIHKQASLAGRLILLYADDIALISESEDSPQRMLDVVNNWCQKWQLNINCTKTEIIQFRKMSENESEFEFKIGNNIIQKVNRYKYLGVELNYCLNFTETVNTLATASSRSLGSLVHKYYSSNGLY